MRRRKFILAARRQRAAGQGAVFIAQSIEELRLDEEETANFNDGTAQDRR